jgi:hypothetical protein
VFWTTETDVAPFGAGSRGLFEGGTRVWMRGPSAVKVLFAGFGGRSRPCGDASSGVQVGEERRTSAANVLASETHLSSTAPLELPLLRNGSPQSGFSTIRLRRIAALESNTNCAPLLCPTSINIYHYPQQTAFATSGRGRRATYLDQSSSRSP